MNAAADVAPSSSSKRAAPAPVIGFVCVPPAAARCVAHSDATGTGAGSDARALCADRTLPCRKQRQLRVRLLDSTLGGGSRCAVDAARYRRAVPAASGGGGSGGAHVRRRRLVPPARGSARRTTFVVYESHGTTAQQLPAQPRRWLAASLSSSADEISNHDGNDSGGDEEGEGEEEQEPLRSPARATSADKRGGSTGHASSPVSRPPSSQLQHLPSRVFLSDIPLLPFTELYRAPARWERVGAYAVFDDTRTLRYVAYSKNVLAKLELHARLQRRRCHFFKAFFPPRDAHVSAGDLERVLATWIDENDGVVPRGNRRPEAWEVESARALTDDNGADDAGGPAASPAPAGRDRQRQRAAVSARRHGADEHGRVFAAEHDDDDDDEDEEFGYDDDDEFEYDDDDYDDERGIAADDDWNRRFRIASERVSDFIDTVLSWGSVGAADGGGRLPAGTRPDDSVRVREFDERGAMRRDDPYVDRTGYGTADEADGEDGRDNGDGDRDPDGLRDAMAGARRRRSPQRARISAGAGDDGADAGAPMPHSDRASTARRNRRSPPPSRARAAVQRRARARTSAVPASSALVPVTPPRAPRSHRRLRRDGARTDTDGGDDTPYDGGRGRVNRSDGLRGRQRGRQRGGNPTASAARARGSSTPGWGRSDAATAAGNRGAGADDLNDFYADNDDMDLWMPFLAVCSLTFLLWLLAVFGNSAPPVVPTESLGM